MKLSAILLMIVSSLFFYSASALNNPVYRVYTEEIDPISYQENSIIVGIATEIVQEIFKQSGVAISIESYPWARAYNNVINDKNGFVYPLVKNNQRENEFHWIGPIIIRETAFWALKSRADITPVDDIEGLRQYSIGVTNKESIHQVLRDNSFSNLHPVTHSRINVMKLIHNRIDIMPANNYTVMKKIENTGYSKIELKKVYVYKTGGYYLGVNKSVPLPVVDTLNRSLEEIKKTNFVEHIHVKYGVDYDRELYRQFGFGI